MKSWQFRKISSHYNSPEKERLYINEGRHKGNYCTFQYGNGSKASVIIDGKTDAVEVNYTAIEQLDEFGKMKIYPVMDMTGREITLDCYIAYSVSAGRGSHALEIGKVYELTKVGGVKVRRVVHNGDKVSHDSWRRNEHWVNDPFRSIRLPVDDTTMIMWIMQEFDEMAKQK